MRFLRISYLLLLLGLAAATAARAQGRVSGVVQDSATHEALPFSSVFLANTTMGMTTDENGRFSFERVPRGSYDIVGSFVGYGLGKQHITVAFAPQTVTLELAAAGPKLGEVVVQANAHAADDYRHFADIFLGQSTNSRQCRILNPGDVDVTYQDSTQQLTASTDTYVQVENGALGYRVKYYGLRFAYDADDGTTSFYSQPVFEEMKPKDDAQRRAWAAARAAAYNGSFQHFLQSVRSGRLRPEGFIAQQVVVSANPAFAPADSQRVRLLRRVGRGSHTPAQQDSLDGFLAVAPLQAKIQPGILPLDSLRRVSADGQRVWLRFRHELQVAYFGEAPDPRYGQRMSPLGYTGAKTKYPALREVSRLGLLVPEVEIQPNGTLDDPLAVRVGEYWGFEKTGELLPLDYQPPTHAPVALP